MGTEWPALIEQSCRLFGMLVPSIHKWVFVRHAGTQAVAGKLKQAAALIHFIPVDCAFVTAQQ